MKKALGLAALIGVVALTGCGRESDPSLTAPDLRTNPELAAASASENFATDEAQDVVDQRGIAIGPASAGSAAPPADVHIITWPYKTTKLTHVRATTDYTDPTGRHWYHIKSGWFKSRYYFIPRIITAAPTSIEDGESFPYPTYEGVPLLPIADVGE